MKYSHPPCPVGKVRPLNGMFAKHDVMHGITSWVEKQMILVALALDLMMRDVFAWLFLTNWRASMKKIGRPDPWAHGLRINVPLEEDEEPCRRSNPTTRPHFVIDQHFDRLTTLSKQLESAAGLSSSSVLRAPMPPFAWTHSPITALLASSIVQDLSTFLYMLTVSTAVTLWSWASRLRSSGPSNRSNAISSVGMSLNKIHDIWTTHGICTPSSLSTIRTDFASQNSSSCYFFSPLFYHPMPTCIWSHLYMYMSIPLVCLHNLISGKALPSPEVLQIMYLNQVGLAELGSELYRILYNCCTKWFRNSDITLRLHSVHITYHAWQIRAKLKQREDKI